MEKHFDAYLATVAKLEPDITPIDNDAALASIAISLKRIADALRILGNPPVMEWPGPPLTAEDIKDIKNISIVRKP